jgi:predicted O-methyltransferase YrrM
MFSTAGVDRELAMIDLKRQVNALSRQLGLAAPYDVSFADAAPKDQL